MVVARSFLSALPSRRDERPQSGALDVGFGFGFALMALADLGYEPEGIDVDAGQVAVAEGHGLDVQLVECSERFVRDRPGRYAVVTLLDTLEHVPLDDQAPLLAGIRVALETGGRLVVTVPNANALGASRWRYIDLTHHLSYTEHSLRFLLRSAGFTQVEIMPSRPLGRPPLRVWQRAWPSSMRNWLVRWGWRQALIVQFGEEGRAAPTDLNLVAVASG